MLNSDSKPYQNHEIGFTKRVHRKVYRDGVVRFSQMLYTGECLKNYEGRDVTLWIDPDHILEMRTYESTNNDTLGEFLGHIKMINSEGLGLSKDQLEAGDLSLEELKAILANARANMKAADESARRLKERVRRMEAVVVRKGLKNRKLKKEK